MTTRDQIIATLHQQRELLRSRYPIPRLALFGSWARGDAREDSDVDVLVEVDGTTLGGRRNHLDDLWTRREVGEVVGVVGHERPGVKTGTGFEDERAEAIEEAVAVAVGPADPAALDAADDEMVHGTGAIEARAAWHG